jgi:hypothetical protein
MSDDPRAQMFRLMERYNELGKKLDANNIDRKLLRDMDKIQAQIDAIIEENAVR